MNKEALSENYFQRANIRIVLGKYEKAIADFDRALDLHPQNADFYSNRGLAKSSLGHYEEAIADFDTALDLNPQHAHAYSNRGLAKSRLGQHEEARVDLQHASELAMEQGNEELAQRSQKLLNELSSDHSHEKNK